MKTGDLVVIKRGRHSYPTHWKMGDDPCFYDSHKLVIFLSKYKEVGTSPRTFYRVLTTSGIHEVNSDFCEEIYD